MCLLKRALLRFMGKLGSAKACKPYTEVSAPKPEPTPVLEKVTCNCPEYRGSDFWNDPHRWCSCDPTVERFWMLKQRPCERTYKPIKPSEPVDTSFAQALSNIMQPNYLGQMQQQGQMGLQQDLYHRGARRALYQQSNLLDLLQGIAGLGRVW